MHLMLASYRGWKLIENVIEKLVGLGNRRKVRKEKARGKVLQYLQFSLFPFYNSIFFWHFIRQQLH